MDQNLKTILDFIEQNESLSAEDKASLVRTLTTVDKELSITAFKLDRTEKVKRTTAILLEETIEELEQKRKAVEAQNREFEIEAALERVRSRSMAMHDSADLSAVVYAMFTELVKLDAQLDRCLILIVNPQTLDITWYLTGKEGLLSNNGFLVPDNPHPSHQAYLEGWRTRHKKWNYLLCGEEKRQWDAYGFSETGLAQLPDFIKADMSAVEAIHLTISSDEFGCLIASSLSQLSDVHSGIVDRFTTVFNQTYTRFLDLQKAEAQAKEAKIEAALERVRSRTMAMHKSDELHESAEILFSEMHKLGIKSLTAGYVLMDKEEKNGLTYAPDPSTKKILPMPVVIPHDQTIEMQQVLEHWQKKSQYYVVEMDEDATINHQTFIAEHSVNFTLNAEQLIAISPSKLFLHNFYFKEGYLLIVGGNRLSVAETDIMLRFTKVFQQTYTRFLDLQKAEAQAREAQIEAALEKVRSRTMAMRGSDELLDVATILFQQVKALGVPQWNCGFNIWEIGDEEFIYYPGTPDGIISQSPCRIPLNEHPVFKSFDESRKRGDELFIYEKEGEMQRSHYQYMLSLPGVGDVLQSMLDAGFEFPVFQIDHVVNFAYGNLIFITYEHFPEMHEVFKRFAKVFEQTYTRFLDLQKAEAQAREAQIEAALERVRAASMAMHKSQELIQVVGGLDKEIQGLGIETNGTQIVTDFNNPEEGVNTWFTVGGQDLPEKFHVPYFEHPLTKRVYNALHKGVDFYTEIYSKTEKNKYFRLLFKYSDFRKTSKERQEFVFHSPAYIRAVVVSKNSILIFQRYDLQEFTKEEEGIFKRFGKVFEQAYTRFLDLQKAEEQAREAQIEAALERVRSTSLAMHHSEQLEQVVVSIFDRLVELGLSIDGAGIFIFDKVKRNIWLWIATKHLSSPALIDLPYDDEIKDNAIIKDLWNAIESGGHIFNKSYTGETKNDYFRYVTKYNESKVPESVRKIQIEAESWTAYFAAEKNAIVGFDSWSGPITTITDSDYQILLRFAKVFDQAYIRFLDLQKAEAQAREAKIEAALERVRARTMGMQKSEDLRQVVKVLYAQLKELGFQSGAAAINIMDYDSGDIDTWSEGFEDGYDLPEKYHVPYFENRGQRELIMHWKSGTPYAEVEIAGQDKQSFDNYYFFHTDFVRVPESTKQLMMNQETVLFSMAYMQYGALTWTPSPISDEQSKILQRFAKVFEQTYTRFLDLQKAEAQAREAQIEAALERVRAQAMAMHHTEDLAKTIKVYFEQLDELIDSTIVRCGAGLLNRVNRIAEMSTASKSPEGETYHVTGTIDMQGHPLLDKTYEHWLKQKEYHHVLRGNEIQEYYQYITNQVAIPENKGEDAQHFYFPMFTEGSFYVVTYKEVPEDELQIFRRFSSVLSLTYRRFNDLQKAEAQAREAQIEASLERLRSKTMAMHNSHDVGDTVAVMFDELTKLGIEKTIRCGIIIIDDSKHMEVWNASSDQDGKIILVIGRLDMTLHPALLGVYHAWEAKQPTFSYEFIGQDLKDYFQAITNYADYPLQVDISKLPSRYYNNEFFFVEGAIFAFTLEPIPPEMSKTIKRFAGVFGQTYRRYLDLQKAEAQAVEAIKRASVDRVRAEIASMRTTTDLERITPLIWNELTTLSVPFIRSGVFIMDEAQQQVQVHLSTPDGKAIAAFRLNYEATNQSRQIVSHWHEMKIFKDHMDEAAFAEYTKNLVQQGVVASDEKYVTENLPKDLYLHFLPFLQGMLYVGNVAPLKAEELQLVQNLADAFSTAYARYEDFNQLEEAKKQTEKTLSELKATQTQLIHAEKMASLGELTAGIAHEIQNPLNFVNNFSEVSKEMIEELKAERQKVKGERDENLEEELLDYVVQNLEKINHHGKRAADIVKGMLQHSRTSSGQKEPTDINALADEYLRLAYHGLRAKDKSFNAEFKTELDSSLPKISVVGQDIGRVLLNLINNAFYAVTQKAKLGIDGYRPVVVLQTKKRNNTMEIKVKDNGDGIPANVINKIFQPFFTTKPTGEGTGLGLSLSYDIITKGHNGSLEVDTTEGVGTDFIVQLPMV